MSLALAFLLGAGLVRPQEQPGLNREQSQALRNALFVEGLSQSDLHVSKPLTSGNPFIVSAHRDPIATLLSLSNTLGSLERPLERIRKLFSNFPDPPSARRPTTEVDLPEDIPTSMRSPLIRLIRAVLTANDEVKDALELLSLEDRRTLIEALPRYAVHPSLASFDFVRQELPAWPIVEKLLKKVDLQRIQSAAERLYVEVEDTLPDLDAGAPPSFRSKLKFASAGIVVVIAGFESDTHDDRDAMLTVDLGGNDRYVGRHGAGIGYASVLVDMGGDDIFEVPDVSLGAGLLGIGLAWDLGGKDRFYTKSACLGSGIGGVGCFRAGDAVRIKQGIRVDVGDDFESESLSQGFGYYGIGILDKSGKDDLYRAKYLSQGAALEGGIGVLSDISGRDVYISKGLAPSLESDSILRSKSQGFGQGGVGMLISSELGAECSAGTEAQGCGLEGGFGVLIGSSLSTYRTEGYGQGYGSEQGIGAILGGHEFVCRNGAAQGQGIQSGVGFIQGSIAGDVYSLGQGRQAVGADGGLGILLDFGGVDRYSSAPSATTQDLRHSGLGLALDLGGPNWIGAPSPASGLRSNGLIGIVAEMESRSVPSESLSISGSSGSVLAEAAIESAVDEASGRAPYATRSMRIQAKKSLEASISEFVTWAISLNRPMLPCEVELAGGMIAAATSELRTRVAQSQVPNALRIMGIARLEEGKDRILAALKNPDLAELATQATMDLGLTEAAPELMILCGTTSGNTRRSAAIALVYLGGQDAFSTALALLGNEDPFVRVAAVELIRRIGSSSLAPLEAMAKSSSEIGARFAIRAIGAIGTAEALAFVGPLLSDRRPEVRIEALRALEGRCPAQFRANLDARRQDADARVRAVAQTIDPGR